MTTSPLRRPVWGWLATVLYLWNASSIGAPLPRTWTATGLYPCMFHHCGCQSAEECWAHCCCYTRAERLAWARANHVAAQVTLAADDGDSVNDSVSTSDQAQSGKRDWTILPKIVSICSGGVAKQVGSSCCAAHSESPADSAGSSTSGERPEQGVAKVSFPPCHGATDNWQGASVAIPLVPPEYSIAFDPAPLEFLCESSPSSWLQAPPVPPPRTSRG